MFTHSFKTTTGVKHCVLSVNTQCCERLESGNCDAIRKLWMDKNEDQNNDKKSY